MRPTLALLSLATSILFAEVAPEAHQIAAALRAAPEDLRAGATVLGYDTGGKLGVLREGSNELHCLADTPDDDRFSVACYHKDLEAFMARGRELAAQGYEGKERHQVRWRDVDEGRVNMPSSPRMLYVLTGKGYDASRDEIVEPYLRWVVYTPYATPESLGLPGVPDEGPWLMYPGTAGAHIMLSPPRP